MAKLLVSEATCEAKPAVAAVDGAKDPTTTKGTNFMMLRFSDDSSAGGKGGGGGKGGIEK